MLDLVERNASCDVTFAQLLVGRVHEVVRGGELDRHRAHAELAVAAARWAERDLDRGAADPHREELDLRDRGQSPTRRRHQVPEQRADEIDLDIAQPTHVRSLDDAGRIRRIEERGQDPVGDRGTRRGEMAVDADVARERAEMSAGVRDLDPERDVGGGEPIGGACADRDIAIAQPRADLRDAEPGEMAARSLDARIERRGRCAYREHAQAGAAALIALRLARPRVGAEVGDIELEALDVKRPGLQIDEREPAHATEGVKRERQTPRSCRRTHDSHAA